MPNKPAEPSPEVAPTQPNWVELKERHANDMCANCHRPGRRHFGGGVRSSGLYCQANGMKQFVIAATAQDDTELHCLNCHVLGERHAEAGCGNWQPSHVAVAPRETRELTREELDAFARTYGVTPKWTTFEDGWHGVDPAPEGKGNWISTKDFHRVVAALEGKRA